MIVRITTREAQAESRERLEQAISDLNAGTVPVPDESQIFVGDGPYLKIASEFLKYFVESGGLRPGDTVLDVGCGIGRMAVGLSRYLDGATGRYIGFDPVAAGIDWCRQAFADRPNFSFHWADLRNELYNPGGTIDPVDYVFPAESGSVDLVIATSVLTHLYQGDIRAYLMEASRVLSPQGRVFATAYLYRGEAPASEKHIAFKAQSSDTPTRWHIENTPPLAGVCYQEDYFRGLVMGAVGREPIIRPGRWCGGDGPWFQDVVIV